MAFYEQEFIEIRREEVKMEIVGTMLCSVEQEDVRKYILSRIAKAKRARVFDGVLAVISWLLVLILPVGNLFLTNDPNPRLGGGTLVLTAIFALGAIFCTVVSGKNISALTRNIAQMNPDSPEQLLATAPDATERSLRQFEEKKLVEYAATLTQNRAKGTAPGSDALLLVYLDIERLGGGVYGFAAGQAVARMLSAADMEGVAISSGDSSATLGGSANEYAIGLSGDASRLDRIEAMLCSDTALENLLSRTGIRRGNSNEPLVADGEIRNGELIGPPGHSASFCAAGFKETWKKNI